MRAINRVLRSAASSSASSASSASSTLVPPNSSTETRRRRRRPVLAITRLQSRAKDLKLDAITSKTRKLNLILSIYRLLAVRIGLPYLSVQLFSRLAPRAGLNVFLFPAGSFLSKYPHIFHRFQHPVRKHQCFQFTSKFLALFREEQDLLCTEEFEKLNVMKIKRLLLMSLNGRLHLQPLRLLRAELGLPIGFRKSLIEKYDQEFRLVDLETVELVDRGKGSDVLLRVAKIEEWRQKEYDEKWLGEREVKYSFPLDFPTGFKKGPDYKVKLRNWQMLRYVKPYQPTRTHCSEQQYEKRAVGIIHEILWLTVEKRMEVERLAHFRKDLGFMVNVRELLLKHPGIFYISLVGNNQMLFLREAYHKGRLIAPNPIYYIKKKMSRLVQLGRRDIESLLPEELPNEESSIKRAIQRTHTSPRVDDLVNRYLGSDANHEGSKEESSKNICQRTNTGARVDDFIIKISGSDTNDEGSKEESE